MTIHDEIQLNLSAYIDGELAGDAAQAVQVHLAVCQPCRLVFEQLQETRRLLHTLPIAPAPRSMEIHVEPSKIISIHRKRWTTLVLQFSSGIAAVLALIFFLGGYFSSQVSPSDAGTHSSQTMMSPQQNTGSPADTENSQATHPTLIQKAPGINLPAQNSHETASAPTGISTHSQTSATMANTGISQPQNNYWIAGAAFIILAALMLMLSLLVRRSNLQKAHSNWWK